MDTGLVKLKLSQLKCCIIIPTYNNDATLQQLMEETIIYASDIIVINDGSTDKTNDILNNFKSIHTISFNTNCGKGKALQAGFKEALARGFDYAISIDSDGQHIPGDIIHFIDAIEKQPGSLLVGARNMNQDSIPAGSSFGNRFSNFWFWVETGLTLPDTQSGFRLYPIYKLKEIHFFTSRFEFEIEVLVKASWSGIKIIPVPVQVYYAPAEERISHFRPFSDFARIGLLNAFLVPQALIYYLPKRLLHSITRKKIAEFFKKNFTEIRDSRFKKSMAVAVGIMAGILPIWGYQLIFALFLAVIFKLNKIIVAVASNISIPPMIPFILLASIKTGGWILNKEINFTSGLTMETVKSNLMIYITGSIALALAASFISGIVTYLLLSLTSTKKVRQSY